MKIRVQFLGTGTSTGVPVIGCDCLVCTSKDTRDTRFRSSILVEVNNATLLIDTSPDLRSQVLRARIRKIDAVLFTHAHADHTAGLDELRSFNVLQEQRIPVWATPDTSVELQTRFGYAFTETFPRFGLKPDLNLNLIEEPFQIADTWITPIPIMHGSLPIVGFRIGNFAYLTDLKSIPEESRSLLADLDVLVITALRHAPHPAHLSIDEALQEIDRIQPKSAWLTHISHDFGLYAEMQRVLPGNVHIASDGEVITSS